MIPKKAKELIPEVAELLNFSEETVKDIVLYYWAELRKSISSLKHCRIHATNLGDFTIKHWKLDDRIKMLETFEENNKLKGLQEITTRFKVAETLYDLKNIKKIVGEESERKSFIKLHKNHSDGFKSKHI